MMEQNRAIATRIIRLRRLLQLGMIAELRDDVAEYDRLIAEFDRQVSKLPLLQQHALSSRVVKPSQRKVEREGILAQSPGADHVHLYLRFDELETWLCDCGASYMGAAK